MLNIKLTEKSFVKCILLKYTFYLTLPKNCRYTNIGLQKFLRCNKFKKLEFNNASQKMSRFFQHNIFLLW